MGKATKIVSNVIKSVTSVFSPPKAPEIKMPAEEQLQQNQQNRQEEQKPAFVSEVLKLRRRNKSVGLGFSNTDSGIGDGSGSSGIGIPM